MEPEDMRASYHEAGHALWNLIAVGQCGRVELDSQGGGSCRAVWSEEAKLSGSDAALLCYGLHACMAGLEAEEIYWPSYSIAGAMDDLLMAAKIESSLADHAELKGLSRASARMTVRYLLREYARPHRGLAKKLPVGLTKSSDEVTAYMLRYADDTLKSYVETPLLAHNWLARWRDLQREAGMWVTRERLGLSA